MALDISSFLYLVALNHKDCHVSLGLERPNLNAPCHCMRPWTCCFLSINFFICEMRIIALLNLTKYAKINTLKIVRSWNISDGMPENQWQLVSWKKLGDYSVAVIANHTESKKPLPAVNRYGSNDFILYEN